MADGGMMRIRDWVLPTLERVSQKQTVHSPVVWPPDIADSLVMRIHDELRHALDAETDRMKLADTKLIAVGSVAPVAMTIVMGIVTFLTSRNLPFFTTASVFFLIVLAVHITSNLLVALLSAVWGLQARGYRMPVARSLIPVSAQSEADYMKASCEDLVIRIDSHREVTNGKFSRLAVAHQRIINGVVGLLASTVVLSSIALFESWNA